jgi:hypothetical protein
MKVRLFASMALVLVLVMSSGMLVQAMEPPGFPESAPWEEQPWPPSGPGSAWQELAEAQGELASQDTGGPDDFGYTWDDSVPFNWIEATGGTKLEFSNRVSGPVDIGFPFKFYENTYTQLRVSQNGFLSFEPSPYPYLYGPLPSPHPPNDDIAPYGISLELSGEGSTPASGVYVLRGGQAPVRYLVVQWQDVVSRVREPSDYDVFTFQAVLYESGDILFQYRDMRFSGHSYGCTTIGIEDSSGMDGLEYGADSCVPQKAYRGNAAILIRRPPASARVQVRPLHSGSLTRPGGEVPYAISVRNTGELGADVYDVTVTSAWPAALYREDGTTPLADSDGDGAPDTGMVLQGGGTNIVVKVQAPAGAAVGQENAAWVQVTSSLNAGKSKTATLRAAIPAPFAQAYADGGALSLYLSQPWGQAGRQLATGGGDVALAETPGGFAYVWSQYRWVSGVWTSELWYALLDWHGELTYGPARLTNHLGATIPTDDSSPVVAAASDGHIGVLWERWLYDDSRWNENLYFAVIAPSGALRLPPTNLTNNSGWQQWDHPTYGVPNFWDPAIAATGDNRFVLAWCREHQEPPGGGCSEYCYVTDIYYAVRDSGGAGVRGITRLTRDDPGGGGGNYSPNLAGLSGSRVLLSWDRDGDIRYAALDSAGNVVHAETQLTDDAWQSYDNEPKARQLSDGRTIVAWARGWWPAYRVRFAVLDNSLNQVAGPVALENPAAVTGEGGISVAADASGRAILTWMDSQVDRNLSYALVDSNGSVLTQPMIFLSASDPAGYIRTSYLGCGNASYSWQPASEPDGAAWFATSLVGGSPGGSAAIQVRYGNYGQQTLSGATLTLELPAGLTYLDDTSGIAPTVQALAAGAGLTAAGGGTRVSWSLPDMEFFSRREFQVVMGLPSDAQLGERYDIRLTLAAEGDANLADNGATGQVMAAALRFLPLVFSY